MKENIPTIKKTIGEGESAIELEIYEWLTQAEEDEYMGIMTGGSSLSALAKADDEGANILSNVSYEVVVSMRNYLVAHLLKNFTVEQVSDMSPNVRSQIYNEIQSFYGDLKKK